MMLLRDIEKTKFTESGQQNDMNSSVRQNCYASMPQWHEHFMSHDTVLERNAILYHCKVRFDTWIRAMFKACVPDQSTDLFVSSPFSICDIYERW